MKAVFLDLSGVLYEGTRPLPGALQAVERLQRSPLTLRFLTNTSRRNRHQILSDLHRMGFSLDPTQLFTAPAAAARWLKVQGLRPYLLVHPDIRVEFQELDQREPNAVVLGDAEEGLNYGALDAAFALLLTGAPLIAIADNRYFKADGRLHLDAGPFVRALEYAADIRAVVTGKPAPAFFREVLGDAGLCPADVLMVGDDIHGDVEGTLRAGLNAALVRTGKYRPGDEARIQGEFQVHDNLCALVDSLLGPGTDAPH